MIAISAILGQIIIQNTLENQSEDSRIINIAGRQRMLSQKISKIALSTKLPHTEPERTELIAELRLSVDQWQKAHNALQYGSAEFGLSAENSAVVKVLFKKIELSYNAMLEASQALLEFNKISPGDREDPIITKYVNMIMANEEYYLSGMDKIVKQYERESIAKFDDFRLLETVLTFLIIAVLFFEGLFVFKPAQKRIKKTIAELLESESKLKDHTENLEKLVEKRSTEILESEKKYRTLFEHSGDANLIIENGLFVDCNQATVDMLLYKNKKELLQIHPSELSPEIQPDGQKSFEKANEMMNIALENGTHRFEWEHKRADGVVFPVEVLLTAISVENGSQVIHTVWRDITERKEAEEQLVYEKTYFAALLESAPEAIAVLDNEERITNINIEFTRLFGYEIDDIKDKFINDVIIPADLKKEGKAYTLKAQKGERIYAETKRLHQDGSLIDISLLGAPILNAKEEQIGTYAIYRNLTEANNFRKLLINKDKKLETILETAINSIITINSKGIIESFNKFAVKIFGYKAEEVIGKNVSILMEEPDKGMHDSHLAKHMRTGESNIIGSSREVVARKKNGETFPAELFVHRIDLEGETIFVGLMNDITARIEFQAEQDRLNINLERAQRMESLGLLAGGVAHDLNNIIGPIIAYPELILLDLPKNTPAKDDLLAIKSAAERAADVISDLLALARRGKYTMQVLNLGDLIEKYIGSPEFKDAQANSIHVVTENELSNTLPNIKGSKSHLHKMLMNIVNNAFDSMDNAGKLTIRTRKEYTEGKSLAYDKIPPGEYVVLEVEDQGAGISEEDMGVIFDPFFTTKRQVGRRGSGLGLSVVYGIVKDHKGFIDVESRLGEGTKFSLYFPITTEQQEVKSITSGDYSGTESLLIVDDNEDQIIIASKLLSSLGYKISSSENGRKAVDQIKSNKVDLVLLDMIMEDDFSGLDTYREIIKSNPGQKAIIVSGFSETDQVKEAMKLGVGKYIKKPYDVDEIGRAVREELDKEELIS